MKTVGVIFAATFLVLVSYIVDTYAIPQDNKTSEDATTSISNEPAASGTTNDKSLRQGVSRGDHPATNTSSKEDIDHRDKNGFNAIYYAVKENAPRTAAFLADLGADLSQVYGNNSLTLLQVADEHNSTHTKYWLTHRDISANASLNGAGVNARNSYNYNALYYAVREGAVDTASTLVDLGADLRQLYPVGDVNLLEVAALFGRLRSAKWLLSKGFSVNSTTGTSSFMPLHMAAYGGQLPMIKFLLENDACIDCRTESGGTALHYAAEEGHLPVVKELLKVSSCINCTSIYGSTPLHYAAREGRLPVVKLLVESGACLNCRKDQDQTPLYLADSGGHPEVAEYLKSVGGVN